MVAWFLTRSSSFFLVFAIPQEIGATCVSNLNRYIIYAMVWEIVVYAEIACSVIHNTLSMTIYPLVQLHGGVAYVLFETFSACDEIRRRARG